jgi:uncharacterized protein YbaP (TraB family)
MKKVSVGFIASLLALTAFAQSKIESKTLLWKISGNGIEKPSYLFGTIHMLCKEEAFLSTNLVNAIKNADRVYFELDMDNLFDMLGAMTKMKMNNDTTLADLLSPEDYKRMKEYFESRKSMLPFSVLETYKPLIASSLIMESVMSCDQQVAMEQLIMEEAKKYNKRIEGLETTAYQMSIFDSIPYKVQVQELLKMINTGDEEDKGNEEYNELMNAYREQDLEKLGRLISQNEDGMMLYEDILLNNRNRNWVTKLKTLLPGKPLVIAVGAGHLPGNKGVINLLRKEGFTVTPVENKMPKKVREI